MNSGSTAGLDRLIDAVAAAARGGDRRGPAAFDSLGAMAGCIDKRIAR